MATQNDFEHRRRERRRRERRRKKRIRAAVMLIALIGVIVLIVVFLSTCRKKDEVALDTQTETETTTAQAPEYTAPTAIPVSSSFSNIPPASEENDLLEIIENSGETRHCYLTFDDGPTDNITPQILDTLRRYNIKATFFQIGSLIEANPDMARRVYEEGHLIANHSDGHNYAKLYVSTETFMNEINKCYEAIKDVTGEAEPFKLVRFPGGSYNSSADSYSPVKQQCKSVLADYGFYYCDWNALNGDAEGKSKNAAELLDYMISNLYGEENVVVLMHDAAAKQATADALASIIEYFMDEGYTFHRLDDIDYKRASSVSSSSYDYEDDEEEDYEDEDTETSGSSRTGSANSSLGTTVTTPRPQTSSNSSGSNSGVIIIQ